jgi:hypothetical protein
MSFRTYTDYFGLLRFSLGLDIMLFLSALPRFYRDVMKKRLDTCNSWELKFFDFHVTSLLQDASDCYRHIGLTHEKGIETAAVRQERSMKAKPIFIMHWSLFDA